MVKTLLEAICLDAKFCQSEVIARSAREALRLLDSGYYEPLQTGELLTREKIREAVRRGLPGANAQAAQELVESITSAVCELLSAGGARAIPDALNQCRSYYFGRRCSHQEGHKGPHQEGNEVWYA